VGGRLRERARRAVGARGRRAARRGRRQLLSVLRSREPARRDLPARVDALRRFRRVRDRAPQPAGRAGAGQLPVPRRNPGRDVAGAGSGRALAGALPVPGAVPGRLVAGDRPVGTGEARGLPPADRDRRDRGGGRPVPVPRRELERLRGLLGRAAPPGRRAGVHRFLPGGRHHRRRQPRTRLRPRQRHRAGQPLRSGHRAHALRVEFLLRAPDRAAQPAERPVAGEPGPGSPDDPPAARPGRDADLDGAGGRRRGERQQRGRVLQRRRPRCRGARHGFTRTAVRALGA
jgi:hypothetical protein